MLTSVKRETTPVTSTPTAATSTEPTSVSVKVASQETDLCASVRIDFFTVAHYLVKP